MKSLKKEPAPLARPIWLSLKKYELLRTPDEQRHHLLFNAPDSAFEETTYSAGMIRTLRSVLALDQRTEGLEICFKSRHHAELDLLLDGLRLLVNDKWLDFEDSHAASFCSLFDEASADEVQINTFSCGHVVTELYDLILVELSSKSSAQLGIAPDTDSSLYLKVSEKIRQTPHKIECHAEFAPGMLHVSWLDPESEKDWKLHGVSRRGRVILHRESTCTEKRHELLASTHGQFRHQFNQSIGEHLLTQSQIIVIPSLSPILMRGGIFLSADVL